MKIRYFNTIICANALNKEALGNRIYNAIERYRHKTRLNEEKEDFGVDVHGDPNYPDGYFSATTRLKNLKADHLSTLSDEQLLAIRDVGKKSVQLLRTASQVATGDGDR